MVSCTQGPQFSASPISILLVFRPTFCVYSFGISTWHEILALLSFYPDYQSKHDGLDPKSPFSFTRIILFSSIGIKCPVCSKFVMPDDIECHLVMCLTKPRLNYNGCNLS